MTLNGRNAPLAEINKNSGAHQKNCNENYGNRPISLVAKYRPMRILTRNIKCMQLNELICIGVPSERASIRVM